MGIESYLKDIRKYPPFTKEEERIVLHKAKAGDRAAYEELMSRNLRFVVSVAKKYQNQGIPLEDLIGIGNAGLIKAFKDFDLNREVKFITYAVWWIKQGIMDAIHHDSRLIRLPLNIISELTKLNKLKKEIEQDLGRPLNTQELLELTENDEIRKAIKYNYSIIDIDASRTDNDKDLTNVIEDVQAVDVQLSVEDINEELELILEDFSEREKDILLMYFGINHPREYTLKEIGVDKGLTRERIRQIKEKTINKLKEDKYANQLREYLE
jgi:RNA polymerase primary sigma factor